MRAMIRERWTLPPAVGAALTFAASACVLVLEIAAGRLLAPYVGVSLTTWTSIIGVILGGIALGAWAGGRLADRTRPDRLLGPTFILGGLAAMAAVPVVGAVGGAGLGSDPVAIVTLAALGFVAPAAILSAVAPMIVRASLTDVGTSGSLVGRLSAVGTLGAISGTFLTGFVLLGLVPTRLLILSTGALLVLVGIALVVTTRGSRSTAALALAGVLASGAAGLAIDDPCERESAYFCIRVTSGSDPSERTLVLDRARHASVDLEDPTNLRFRYVRWFADASAEIVEATGGDFDAVHIGGGGFTFARYLATTAPASRHVVLELDPEVLDVARRELGFVDDAAIDVRVGDARLGLATLPDDSADLVIGDAFGGLSVPWHLTTREVLVEIERVLRPGGRYVMNLIDATELRFARAEAATFRAVWPHVALMAPTSALEGSGVSNLVLIGSAAPIDAVRLRARLDARGDRETALLSSPAEIAAFAGTAPVLTDDFAPVDQLLLP